MVTALNGSAHNSGAGAPEGQLALAIDDLALELVEPGRTVPVVTGVHLDLPARQILGLVGESGSGKSLTCLAVLRLLDGRRVRTVSGSVRLFGRELLTLPEAQMRSVRGGEIGIVFQDPMSSLDPSFTVGYQITAVLRRHTDLSRLGRHERALELLASVGIGDPRRRIDLYPHQMSGGMRQRVLIAMAIACQPRVLIADEPTTALDATTQAQILELLKHLAQALEMSTIITTHDLGVVAEVCDRVAVMYAGQIVEEADVDELFYHPKHPYTERLLSSLAFLGEVGMPSVLAGQPPQPGRFPQGCRFSPRCLYCRSPDCVEVAPDMRELARGRSTRCARIDELDLRGVPGVGG
jgi:peptide/nickel transport system ATP-binding protein